MPTLTKTITSPKTPCSKQIRWLIGLKHCICCKKTHYSRQPSIPHPSGPPLFSMVLLRFAEVPGPAVACRASHQQCGAAPAVVTGASHFPCPRAIHGGMGGEGGEGGVGLGEGSLPQCCFLRFYKSTSRGHPNSAQDSPIGSFAKDGPRSKGRFWGRGTS